MVSDMRPGRVTLGMSCNRGHSWFCLCDYSPAMGILIPVLREHAYCPKCGVEERSPVQPNESGEYPEGHIPLDRHQLMKPRHCSVCRGFHGLEVQHPTE